MKKVLTLSIIIAMAFVSQTFAQTTPEAVIGLVPDIFPSEQQVLLYLTEGDEYTEKFLEAISEGEDKVHERAEQSYNVTSGDIREAANKEMAAANAALKAMGVSNAQELKGLSQEELKKRALAASKQIRIAQQVTPTEQSKTDFMQAAKKYSDKDRALHENMKERLGIALDSLGKVAAYYEEYWHSSGYAKTCGREGLSSEEYDRIHKKYWSEVVRDYYPKVIRVLQLTKQLITYDRLFDDFYQSGAGMAGQGKIIQRSGLMASTAYARAVQYLNQAKDIVPNWELYDEQ